MKVHLTKASDIATLSMSLDWRGNLRLVGSCLLGACLSFCSLLILMVLLIAVVVVALIIVGLPAFFMVNAIDFYISDTGWRMGVLGVVCFVGAVFFAYAREQRPRRFFAVLAHGGFWLLATLTLIFSAVGFTFLTETYGKPTVFACLLLLPLAAGFLSYWRTRKQLEEQGTDD